MPAQGRPPIGQARGDAIAKLIQKHEGEYNDFVDEYLASQGWVKKAQTVEKWSKSDGQVSA